MLSQLELHLTQRCNLRCDYCYAAERGGRPDLSPEVADAATDLLLSSPAPRRRLSFWGGEPFLKPDLIERA